MSGRLEGETREAYPVLREIGTRWIDNDAYGHVNNVVYYSTDDRTTQAQINQVQPGSKN